MRASNNGKLLASALVSVLFAGCSQPAPQPSGATAHAPAAQAAPVATPSSPAAGSDEALAWLAGNWCGKDGEQLLEESWLSPHANEAIGMSRTVSGGRMLAFEFIRIMEIEGKLTFVAQPDGDPPTSFQRTDGGDDWIRFENKEHDYPQRIEYRRAGDGLKAEIGGPGAEGKEEVIAYNYTRCPAN